MLAKIINLYLMTCGLFTALALLLIWGELKTAFFSGGLSAGLGDLMANLFIVVGAAGLVVIDLFLLIAAILEKASARRIALLAVVLFVMAVSIMLSIGVFKPDYAR